MCDDTERSRLALGRPQLALKAACRALPHHPHRSATLSSKNARSSSGSALSTTIRSLVIGEVNASRL